MSKNKRLQKLFFLLEANRAMRPPRQRWRHHATTRHFRFWLRFLFLLLAVGMLLGICREFIH